MDEKGEHLLESFQNQASALLADLDRLPDGVRKKALQSIEQRLAACKGKEQESRRASLQGEIPQANADQETLRNTDSGLRRRQSARASRKDEKAKNPPKMPTPREPAKSVSEEDPAAGSSTPEKPRRGRPPKMQAKEPRVPEIESVHDSSPWQTPASEDGRRSSHDSTPPQPLTSEDVRRSGRSRKSAFSNDFVYLKKIKVEPESDEWTPKGATTSQKVTKASPKVTDNQSMVEGSERNPESASPVIEQGPQTPRPRGRPRKILTESEKDSNKSPQPKVVLQVNDKPPKVKDKCTTSQVTKASPKVTDNKSKVEGSEWNLESASPAIEQGPQTPRPRGRPRKILTESEKDSKKSPQPEVVPQVNNKPPKVKDKCILQKDTHKTEELHQVNDKPASVKDKCRQEKDKHKTEEREEQQDQEKVQEGEEEKIGTGTPRGSPVTEHAVQQQVEEISSSLENKANNSPSVKENSQSAHAESPTVQEGSGTEADGSLEKSPGSGASDPICRQESTTDDALSQLEENNPGVSPQAVTVSAEEGLRENAESPQVQNGVQSDGPNETHSTTVDDPQANNKVAKQTSNGNDGKVEKSTPINLAKRKRRSDKAIYGGVKKFKSQPPVTETYFGVTRELPTPKKRPRGRQPKGGHLCLECNAVFNIRNALRTHMRDHKKVKLRCGRCPRFFYHAQALALHIKDHEAGLLFPCQLCTYNAPTDARLKLHLVNKHRKRGVDGDLPNGVKVKQEKEDEDDTGSVRRKGKWSRGKLPADPVVLEQGGYKCLECGGIMPSRKALRIHLKKDHVASKFYCKQCGVVFRYKGTYDEHLKKHATGAVFRCLECKYQVTDSRKLGVHIARHHMDAAERTYMCEWCSKCYYDKKTLDTHIKNLHSAPLNFACDRCSYRGRTAWLLNRHISVHHEMQDGKYVCQLCKAGFKDRQQFLDHRRRHTGERPFECPLCGAAFVCASQLSAHKKIHGERGFMCLKCKKPFLNKFKLHRHMAIHSGVKAFACPYCTYKCNVKSNLYKHCETIHKVEHPQKFTKYKYIRKLQPDGTLADRLPRMNQKRLGQTRSANDAAASEQYVQIQVTDQDTSEAAEALLQVQQGHHPPGVVINAGDENTYYMVIAPPGDGEGAADAQNYEIMLQEHASEDREVADESVKIELGMLLMDEDGNYLQVVEEAVEDETENKVEISVVEATQEDIEHLSETSTFAILDAKQETMDDSTRGDLNTVEVTGSNAVLEVVDDDGSVKQEIESTALQVEPDEMGDTATAYTILASVDDATDSQDTEQSAVAIEGSQTYAIVTGKSGTELIKIDSSAADTNRGETVMLVATHAGDDAGHDQVSSTEVAVVESTSVSEGEVEV